MERMAVVKAVKKVRMISNSNDHNAVSIAEDAVVLMITVAVSIVVHVKRVATLAKVVMESSKVVARKMLVTEAKTVMVRDDTSVAISVVVVEEEAEVMEEEAVAEDVHVTKMAVKVDHRKMDKMVNKEGRQDVVIRVSVVQCVGSKMAMLMVLR